MFKDYISSYLYGWNPNNSCSKKYFISIIDDDFEEKIEENTIPDAIIEIYEKRKLNVAANLFLFFKFLSRGNIYLIKNNINNLIIHTPSAIKYKEDLEKYLSLL